MPDDDTGERETMHLILNPDDHTHMLVVKDGVRTVVCPIGGCNGEYDEAALALAAYRRATYLSTTGVRSRGPFRTQGENP